MEHAQHTGGDGVTDIAIITNEPTPYRAHLNARFESELSEEGFRAHFLYTQPRGKTSVPWDVAESERQHVVYFTSSAGTSRLAQKNLLADIRDYLVANRIRFILLQGYMGPVRRGLIKWAHRANIPLFIRGDSNIFADRNLPIVKKFAKHLYLRRVARQVTGFLPMGTAGRAFFHYYAGRPRPMFLCPYEPSYDAWRTAGPNESRMLNERFGWDPARRRLLYSGRMIGIKRVDIVLRAFVDLAQKRPAWDLVLAGDGPLRELLAASIPPHLDHRVQWLGFQQAEDLAAIYRGCHLLVHAAEYEPWGLIITEAMAAGLPVVTTDVVGAAIELIRDGHNGYITPPGDAELFAAAVFRATDEEHRLLLAVAGADELVRWRKLADPVEGLRRALQHCRLRTAGQQN